jgi:hypothetical protein
VDSFLVEPQNQGRAGTTWETSHEWRLAEATPSSSGLHWFTRKPLGYSVEPKTEAEHSTRRCGYPGLQPPRRGGQTTWAGLTAQGAFDLPGRSSQEASKRRTRVGIARLASRLSKVAVVGHPFDGENLKTSKFTLEGHVSLVI